MERTEREADQQNEEYDRFYHNAVCHVCKEFRSNLKRCGDCKLYAYCSKEHQKIHRKYHKKFCKLIRKLLSKGNKTKHHILDTELVSDTSAAEWRNVKVALKCLWENLLNRELTIIENQLWMFPRACEICRNSNQDILFECKKCHSISYCSDEHQSLHADEHKHYCDLLEIHLELNIHLFHDFRFPEIVFNIDDGVEKLPDNIMKFIEEYTIISNFKHADKLASDFISPILSLLYTLEVTRLVQNRSYIKDRCVIHLIGASLYEQNFPWQLFRELFFNWIKNLKVLTVILIGPELITFDYYRDEKLMLYKNFDLRIERCLYNDYVNSNTFMAPDLMAAYNCGLHEYQSTKNDTWNQSLKWLCPRDNVPLLITAYTHQESLLDLKRFSQFSNLHILINTKQNPFQSLRPLHNWDPLQPPIFYNNYYISILRTK